MENIRIDQLSFWIGFVASAIFMWLWRQARPAFSMVRQAIGERVGAVRQGLSTSAEQRYRQDVLKLYGEDHLTAPLFSMQEIAIQPHLIDPPPPVIPGVILPSESISDIVIPYLPDWPEVGAHFQINTISIPMAMSKGGNLLLTGKPGSGRTFALQLLATQVAQRHPDAEYLGNLIPIYIHLGGLNLKKKDKPIEALYDAFFERVSMLLEANLQEFFKTAFEAKLAFVLADGLDELPKEEQKEAVEFLRNLQKTFPGNRYIVATSEDDLYCQEALNLHPYGLAGWDAGQKQAYIKKWGQLWTEHIVGQSWASELPEIYDPIILNTWLIDDTRSTTPFFLALRVWAAYAGDQRGPGDLDTIESYLNRMTAGIPNARPALENLAAKSIINTTPFLEARTARGYIAAFEERDIPSTGELKEIIEQIETEPASVSSKKTTGGLLEDEDIDALLDELNNLDLDSPTPEPQEEELSQEKDAGKPRGRMLLPLLNEAHLLTAHPNGRYGFTHPIIAGYLAGTNLNSSEGLLSLNQQKNWIGKHLTQQFLPHYQADMTPFLIEAAEEAKTDPIKSRLVRASRWVRYASRTTNWRNNLMRSLAATMQDENLPFGLRARLMSTLAFSGEPGISTLFKQMLDSSKHTVRWLGIIGSAILKNQAVVEHLGDLLYDPSLFVSRAACLALVTIGSNRALEMVTTALLDANDEVRRAAAEALAMHPNEGHPVLKDGVTVEDVQVRRAVVFGLARIKEEWAQETLAQMQIEDEQWVVRNAAIQTIEDMKLAEVAIPEELPPIHETPWLLAFAGERGMGLSPGQSGWDMLLEVLKNGSEDEQLAAMYIYRRKPSEAHNAVGALREIMNGPEGEMREAAYNTLWHLRANGVNLQPQS